LAFKEEIYSARLASYLVNYSVYGMVFVEPEQVHSTGFHCQHSGTKYQRQENDNDSDIGTFYNNLADSGGPAV
jgi:hypothetical protein